MNLRFQEREIARSLEYPPKPEMVPPPFVNELLAAIRPNIISPNQFEAIVNLSKPFEESAILVRMTRDIEVSGFVANLVGTYQTPKEVFDYLKTLGREQFETLKQYEEVDPAIRGEIFDALRGKSATLRAVLILDSMQKKVVDRLKDVRESSPIAMAIRKANETALRNLYRHPEHIEGSGIFLPKEEQRKLFSGEPRICYLKHVDGGAVQSVLSYFLRPDIRSVQFKFDGATQTVAGALSTITPDYYNRRYETNYSYDPKTPEGLMGLLGKVGHPLPHFIAMVIKQDEMMHKKILNQQVSSDEIKNLLRSH